MIQPSLAREADEDDEDDEGDEEDDEDNDEDEDGGGYVWRTFAISAFISATSSGVKPSFKSA